MLVRGEDLDRFARVLCRLLGNGIRELFLNAAASSGVATHCTKQSRKAIVRQKSPASSRQA
jgi:hypothetical protein